MVFVAQLVRASGCGPEGRGFKSRLTPFVIPLWVTLDLSYATTFNAVVTLADSVSQDWLGKQ